MHIAFDAKRAYKNGTGLGFYSRTLISSLAEFFSGEQYYCFTPSLGQFFTNNLSNIHTVLPQGWKDKNFSGLWRSHGVVDDLVRMGMHLYHGLSHEIPVGIQHSGIPSVVTMHDLIFERYPRQYNAIDVQIYRRKFKYACRYADRIIAISRQTKDDLVELYGVDPEKIRVVYQSCSEHFRELVSNQEKERVRRHYQLPKEYLLYVGSLIERKNLLQICKAMHQMGNQVPPLVVIGQGGAYKKKVQQYVKEAGLTHKVIFLSDTAMAQQPAFRSSADFPAIYQQALCMIYPSVFEGFGIPVLEALCSRIPVITSNVSCMPETGGDAALYVDPWQTDAMADAIQLVLNDSQLREQMIQKGWEHSQNFTRFKGAEGVMNVYRELVS